MKTLLYFVATDVYFCSHRLELAIAAQSRGYDVHLVTKVSEHNSKYFERISKSNIKVHALKHMHRSSINPFKSIFLLKELYQIYKMVKPDVVHHVALKPILLGTLIARVTGIPKIINAFAGMGYLFTGEGSIKQKLLRNFVRYMMRGALATPKSTVIVQNQDDKNLILQNRFAKLSSVALIPGAGVDPVRFPKLSTVAQTTPIIITFVARLLWDKGLGELVGAVKQLKAEGYEIECHVAGLPDIENPRCIAEEQLKTWEASGLIKRLGQVTDLKSLYQNCHIACLPSYREGMPKSLLEAASYGRPIVTTDVPGCRAVITDGVEGLLVQVKDSKALASALKTLILDPELREQMGERARERVEREFAADKIFQATIDCYENLNTSDITR